MSGRRVNSKPLPPPLALAMEEWEGRSRVVTAPAKVNVRLKVEGRRTDGYHLLSMVNCTTSLADTLTLTLAREHGCQVEVEPSGIIPEGGGENLVAKAHRLFWSEFSLSESEPGLTCSLKKKIPIGGGLGGGSADAGAVLRFLVEIFGRALRNFFEISDVEFAARVGKVALQCGADVPYAYTGGLCWVGGIGEEVVRIKSPGTLSCKVLLVVPPASISTPAFYERFRRERRTGIFRHDDVGRRFAEGIGDASLIEIVENDFEEVAIRMAPTIGEGLRMSREVFPRGTALTGSGSVFFSLVEESQEGDAGALAGRLSTHGFQTYLSTLNFL